MLYTCVDYHRSFSHLSTMNEKGEIGNQKKLPSNGEIVDFLKGFVDEMEMPLKLVRAGTGFTSTLRMNATSPRSTIDKQSYLYYTLCKRVRFPAVNINGLGYSAPGRNSFARVAVV